MAKLGAIRDDSREQAMKTREAGQRTGAGIVESTFRETNADELHQRLQAAHKEGAANIEAARAGATEQAGTAQNQQGGTQKMVGQTMVAAASVAAASGMGWPASMGMFATGTALVVTGEGNQTKGQQKITEAPPMLAKASDLSNQSQGHSNRAEQIRSERESAQANNEDSSDPDSAKEVAKNKGYFVADSGTAGASTDNELVADRINDAEEAIDKKLGIITGSGDKKGSITKDDKTTIASRLNKISDSINGLAGTKSDKTDGEKAADEELGITTDSDTEKATTAGTETTIANKLKDGIAEINGLLGGEREKVG